MRVAGLIARRSFSFTGDAAMWRNASLSVAAAAALVFVVFGNVAQADPITDPVTINFGVIPLGGTIGFTGASLDTSTAFNLGGGTYIVNQIGAGDESGLSIGSTVSLSPQTIVYGAGDSGTLDLTKSWGAFTETFTSFMANRSSRNAITLDLSGTVLDNGVTEPAFAILSANQATGDGAAVNWSLTNTSTNPNVIPLPGAIYLFGTGLAALGFVSRRRKTMSALQTL